MITYAPKPGSKTAATVAYLRANGGAATSSAICDAIDTDRKNLPAQFAAAIAHGLLEPCHLPDGMGYRLAGTDAPGTPRTPPKISAPTIPPGAMLDLHMAADRPPGEAPWKTPTPRQPKPGVGKNPGSMRSAATGNTSTEAHAVTAQATPRSKPSRRPANAAAMTQTAAGDVIDSAVEHPRHYTSHPSGIECIQITEHMGFNLGNAIKYLWRADLKGAAVEDLNKARWYIDREIKRRTAMQ